jgi:hypothetical protein
MANTMTKIASITVTSGVNPVTFTSIPQTYTDLIVKISARAGGATDAGQGFYVQINGSATAVYSATKVQYYDTVVRSYRNSANNAWLEIPLDNAANTANVFSSAEIYIPNYSNTSNYKSGIIDSVKEQNGTGGAFTYSSLEAVLWRSTAAITQLEIGTNITSPLYYGGSTFTLYGIKNS